MVLSYIFGYEKVNPDVKKKLFLAAKKNYYTTIMNHFKDSNEKDVDKYRDDYGNTLLHVAINYGHTQSMETLLNLGCSIDVVNDLGATPLDILMRKSNRELLNNYINYKYKQLFNERNSLRSNNAVLKNDNKDLTNQIREKLNLISNLETLNQKLKKEVDELTSNKNIQNNNLMEYKNSLMEKSSLLKNLELINNRLREENNNLRSDNTILNQNNKRLREQNDQLEGNNKKLKSYVESLTEAAKKK